VRLSLIFISSPPTVPLDGRGSSGCASEPGGDSPRLPPESGHSLFPPGLLDIGDLLWCQMDDEIWQSVVLRCGESIGITKAAQTRYPVGGSLPAHAAADLVIGEPGVAPCGLGHIPDARHRSHHIPVDLLSLEDGIGGMRIYVADPDRFACRERLIARMPGDAFW
jgi:hypothetical protein